MDPRLLADVNAAEGRRLTAYKDGLGIAPAQSDAWLTQDLSSAQTECESLPEWRALNTPCRQNAVIECVFNLGKTHWVDEFPKSRAAIEAQDWDAARDQLLASPLWVKQVGLDRVLRLADYLWFGDYPTPGQ